MQAKLGAQADATVCSSGKCCAECNACVLGACLVHIELQVGPGDNHECVIGLQVGVGAMEWYNCWTQQLYVAGAAHACSGRGVVQQAKKGWVGRQTVVGTGGEGAGARDAGAGMIASRSEWQRRVRWLPQH